MWYKINKDNSFICYESRLIVLMSFFVLKANNYFIFLHGILKLKRNV